MPFWSMASKYLFFKSSFSSVKCFLLFYKGPWSQNSNQSFDSVGNEAEEVNPNASMTALTSIDQKDVNHAAVKSAGEQLKKVADNTTVSDMVRHYSSRLQKYCVHLWCMCLMNGMHEFEAALCPWLPQSQF